MPAVRLVGHQLHYPLADILRLFFGVPRQPAEDLLVAGPGEPVITSQLSARENEQVQVTTTLADLCFTATVPEKMARREVKRQLYQLLSAWTGICFPWGSLTGIRPTLVALESLRRTGSPELARSDLTDRWLVSPEKADLALETACAEQQLLERLPPGSAMVYLGVPFCPSRCAYCSFIAQDALSRKNLLEPYVDAVIAETTAFFSQLRQPLPISAVYVGGGTPTSLPDQLFKRLLTGVLPQLPCLPDCELTIEAGRPDTVTPEKLAIIRDIGATRLCINPQTFHDATLERIGRRHDTRQTRQAFSLARSMGFDRINMDLIAGLPGETPSDFADSLHQALALGPDSTTIHALAIKRSSRLQQESAGTQMRFQPDPDWAAALEASREELRSAGLLPYYLYRQKDVVGGLENTGFARPGQGCLYNVGMMSDYSTVIGLGSGAMTKRVSGSCVERVPNAKDIADYIRRTAELAGRKLALFNSGAG